MADLLKPAFRASYGVDAAGEKVVNVADTDFTVGTDGVNVDSYIRENTIQQYDSTRGYKKDFAVIHDNRIWVSNQDIPAPAGAFQELRWISLRTDPKWTLINTAGEKQLTSGVFASVDTTLTPVDLKLPPQPQDGETIFIKDIGGKVSTNALKVKVSNQDIVQSGVQVKEIMITKPFSYSMLIFSNKLWQLWTGVDNPRAVTVTRAAGNYQASSGDDIIRTHLDPGPITVILPKNANNGDIIRFTDMDGLAPLNHLIVKTYDLTTFIGRTGQNQIESRTSADGKVIYDAPSRVWRIWDGDIRTRLRVIRDDVTLLPNESVMVIGDNNSVIKTVNITLPKDVANGDKVEIALNYMRYNMSANIIAPTGSILATSKALLQFPKRSDYPPPGQWVENQSIMFSGADDYVPTLELSYVLIDGVQPRWVVSENIPTIERVDATADNTRARLGVIALATQAQANTDKGSNPAKELAITPETLANRTAAENRQGIARIATSAEMNIATTAVHDDLTIVTPKKFNDTTATETRRGVAEIATQQEVNDGLDDTTIVTPKKLEARKATETLPGIIGVVTTGATTTPGVNRTTAGTNIYNNADNTKAVTPKSLFENKATYTAQGGVFLATDVEVINGTQHSASVPTVVTPVELQKKTATETRIGFAELATQVETNTGIDDLRIVTPKKLNDRKASQTLDGIIRIATQDEFNAGDLDGIASPPLKIKTYFSGDRISTNDVTGVSGSGNIWNHYTITMLEASNTQRGTTRLATQGEVDTGTEAKTIVTPATLAKKKATESTEGIIQVASQVETVAGLVDNKAVSPKNLIYVVQSEPTWEATPSRRGFVKISENTITFVGNDTQGSTQALDLYSKNGYAISPYELNKTLANFLPKKATAVNSVKFNDLADTQFIRRDIDQVVQGKLTLSAETIVSAPITSSSTAKFTTVNATTSVSVGDSTAASVINFNAKANAWNTTAAADGTTLDFNAGASKVLSLNRNGNVNALQTITAGNKVEAVSGYSVAGTMIINPTASEIVIGSTAKKTTLSTPDANSLTVTDSTGNHTVLTTKNMVAQVGTRFVDKTGDTMTGKLTIQAPLNVVVQESVALAPLTISNIGTWSSEIKTLALYETLPGYVVPDVIQDGHTVSYKQVKAPGTLSQFGTSATYTYQMWAPRPPAPIVGHNANTLWTRVWDVAANDWGQWNRIFTSEAPPTANDIGAVSTSGSAFDNLTIRDWIQIGNVRIRPNAATRTVDFDWIE